MEGMLDWLMSNAIPAVVGAVTALGGTFLYYKQEKDGKEIENEAKQSEEWRKLYLESQEDSRRKDEKIDKLYDKIDEMNKRMVKMEKQVEINRIYSCFRVACKDRVKNQVEINDTEHQETADSGD